MVRYNQKNKRAAGDINLTPMIDIIFNLLIFFLIVAVISQKGLNIKLPRTTTAEKRPDKSLEILVNREGHYLFDGERVPEDEVESRLVRATGDGRDRVIVLKADEEAPFGRFVVVMDISRRLGLTNLVIATELKPQEDAEEGS